jgi:hypothetical protein
MIVAAAPGTADRVLLRSTCRGDQCIGAKLHYDAIALTADECPPVPRVCHRLYAKLSPESQKAQIQLRMMPSG